MSAYIVLDIETTGLSPQMDEIIEIGAIKVVDGEIKEVFNHLVWVENSLSEFITNLTGITTKMLELEGVPVKKVLGDLRLFIENLPIVGHNVNFDIGFIQHQMGLNLGIVLENPLIDTLTLARRHYRSYNYKLDTLAKQFNKKYFPSHRAINDVLATYELYEGLLKIEKISR
ncbi:MAG: 3'-5' exonuclease [Acholeplasmatales bacterium]|jgi:DNA polymerase-3 subunit alpha (Gram-positive type)|nr:3'-5' exonuclease [Acholeplasmatales bacterium]